MRDNRCRIASLFFGCAGWAAAAGHGLAASFSVATSGGLMQQPSSQYYHATYGVSFTAATATERFGARLSYVERPVFSAVGFEDQDFGWFLQCGSKLTSHKSHGLYAYLGGGQMRGFIRASSETSFQLVEAARRNYALAGVAATAEYLASWRSLIFAINHQTFIGFVDRQQTEARVAWPYTFFQASLGYRW